MIDFKKMSRAELVCWITSIVFLAASFFLPHDTFLDRLCEAGFIACLFIPMMIKGTKKHCAAGSDERSRYVHDVCRLCLFGLMLVTKLIAAQPFKSIISYAVMALGLLLCISDFFMYKKLTGSAVWDEAYAYDLFIVFMVSTDLI